MIENERIKRGKMTAYENLKRKENVLREASRRAESPDMKVLWFEKSKELETAKGKQMEKHVVLLSDGTVGTINPDTIDYQDVDRFIGEEMTVHLNDENGNSIERTGILEAVL